MPKHGKYKKSAIHFFRTTPPASVTETLPQCLKEYRCDELLMTLHKQLRGFFLKLNIEPEKESEQKKQESFDSRARAYKLVQKLIKVDLNEHKVALKSINFIIQESGKTKPSFFIELIRQLLNEKEDNKEKGLSLLFEMECLSDDSIPNIHPIIWEEIAAQNSFELLFYYLSGQPKQIKSMIDESIILWLILGAPSFIREAMLLGKVKLIEGAHYEYLFKLFGFISPEDANLLYQELITKLPKDFPWGEKYKKAIELLAFCLKGMEQINQNCIIKLTQLMTTVPKGQVAPLIASCTLIHYFSQILYPPENRGLLNGFMQKLAQLPPAMAAKAIECVLGALVELTTAWAPLSNPKKIRVELLFFQLRLNQLKLFNKHNQFLRGDVFNTPDNKTMCSILSALAVFSIKNLEQVFQLHWDAEQDTSVTRKQFEIIKLLHLIMQDTYQLLEHNPDGGLLLEQIKPIGVPFRKKLEEVMSSAKAKIYSLDSSKVYERMQEQFQDICPTIYQDFRPFFLDSLHTNRPDILYRFMDSMNEEKQKISLIQFLRALCDEPEVEQCGAIIEDIKSYAIDYLERSAYRASLEIVLNREEMQAILYTQGLSTQDLDVFYTAYLSGNIASKSSELTRLFESMDSAIGINYFMQILDYYTANLSKKEDLLEKNSVQALLILLRTNDKKIKEQPYVATPSSGPAKTFSTEKKQEHNYLEHKTIRDSPQKKSVAKHTVPSCPSVLLEKIKPAAEEQVQIIRAVHKKKLYILYLSWFDFLAQQIQQATEATPAVEEDKKNYAAIHRGITETLGALIQEQEAILAGCNEAEYRTVLLAVKKDTTLIEQAIKACPKPLELPMAFTLHNQVVYALLTELRGQRKSAMSLKEQQIGQHVDNLLVFSFSGVSEQQQALLFWLKELLDKVQKEALGDRLFTTQVRKGFLKAGIFGSFIAQAFQASCSTRYTQESNSIVQHHRSDIDCAFYTDPEYMNHKELTLSQQTRLKDLIHESLTEEARKKIRLLPNSLVTWHGFSYQGQECDITLKTNPPEPVISHCSIQYCLSENKVKFLVQGEHSLLHILSKRLNIIMKKEDLGQFKVFAHVLKKIIHYTAQGITLTAQSKIILGTLFLNTELCIKTICRFIGFYGPQNPQVLAQQFKEVRLPCIINNEERSITLANYFIKNCLILMGRNEDKLVSFILAKDFLPFFEKTHPVDLLQTDLEFFIAQVVEQYDLVQYQAYLQQGFYSQSICPGQPAYYCALTYS